jgi:predicted nucleotidyltransferase
MLQIIPGVFVMIYDLVKIKDTVNPICIEWGIDKLLLFGSYARDEATDNSDLDFIVFDLNNNLSGTKFYALVEDLRNAFSLVNVEVVEVSEKNNMPWINNVIVNEGITVYECGSN